MNCLIRLLFLTVANGKRILKAGAIPTLNLPSKSIEKKTTPQRRQIVKYPLPSPVVHRNFDSLCTIVKNRLIGKIDSCWNFSLFKDKV